MSLHQLSREHPLRKILVSNAYWNYSHGCNSFNILVFCKSKIEINIIIERVLRRCPLKFYWLVTFSKSCAQWNNVRKLIKIDGNYAKNKRNWTK